MQTFHRAIPPFLAVVLIAAASVEVTQAQGVATSNAEPAPRAAPSERPFPVTFVDVAASAGLDMKFASGSEDSKKYIIEANGSGVALLDYDNDGWLDAFLVNGSRLEGFGDGEAATSRLYRNTGSGKFTDVTEKAGVGRAGWGTGICAGDLDNDGDTELFVAYWGSNVLYQNGGDGTFSEIAAKAGVAGPLKEWSSGCTFLDYDRDGFLDLFVTSYQVFDLKTAPPPGKASNCEWKGLPVFCGPRGLPFGGATLYHNRGDGTFEDVSAKAGIRDVQDYYAFTAVAADLNRDGWVDIYVACDSTPSLFFRNNGDGTFSDIATETGIAFNEHGFEQGGMGIGVGDFDRDGWLDMVKTNFAGDYPNVFHNLEDGIFDDIVVRAGLAVNPQQVGWGINLVDLDNDGWQDVFQVNGHVYPMLDKQDRVKESYRQPHLAYRNLGKGRFEDVSAMVFSTKDEDESSRGAAFGDFDNDGDVDVLVMNMGSSPSLLRNDLDSENGWVEVSLEGTKSNRSAIGATVIAQIGDLPQAAAVLSQSSYVSQSDFRVHFGLGEREGIDKFTVHWPSGETEEFPGAAANGRYLLVEGAGETKQLATAK